MTITAKHQILIVGGGTAGITVAARMLRKGYTDVAVIEPSNTHYYQPLWTLVGGGQAKASTTARPEASVMPTQATWIKKSASGFDPDNNTVTCADGSTYAYDVLVVCPGIQLDWNRTEGLEDALGRDGVSSNYRFDLAPRTWDFIRNTRSGTAVFTMPSRWQSPHPAPWELVSPRHELDASRGRHSLIRRSAGSPGLHRWARFEET